MNQQKKLRIGWFSFSCCEDSTVMLTEIMNDHYDTWRKVLDIRHARVLQSKNHMDQMDVAFVEGALACEEHEEKVKEIRSLATKVVAIGSCAIMGMPSAQRNTFDDGKQEEINYLLERFNYGEKVKKLDEVIEIDEVVGGCPMTEKVFLEVLTKMLVEFDITLPEPENAEPSKS